MKLANAVAAALGARIASRLPVAGGYTHIQRWRVRAENGATAFAKVAVDDTTAAWLRAEERIYRALDGAPFLAALLGWHDGARPVLLLEDLGEARWPPPWRDGDVTAVMDALGLIAATRAPSWLDPIRDSEVGRGWEAVADDPQPFLGMGWLDDRWLEAALPILRAAAAACPLDGTSLLHMDVRSDNICFRADGSVVVVDWNLAACGPARLDVAFWLPSLATEGGPMPEEMLSDAGREAAVVAGFFAARAGQPIISVAPLVRRVQLLQLQVALPWACRELGIPIP